LLSRPVLPPLWGGISDARGLYRQTFYLPQKPLVPRGRHVAVTIAKMTVIEIV